MQQLPSLPAELTIYTLAALREEWLSWVRKTTKSRKATNRPSKSWPLDASRVDEVDAAGVQLLLALSRSLAAKNHLLQLVNASGPMRSACTGLGVHMLVAPDAVTHP
jgi:anti-anti-sigma regulatory factor